MKTPDFKNLRKQIDLAVITKYDLQHNCLKLLLENKSSNINFVGSIRLPGELSKMAVISSIDVVLLNLVEDDIENINVIPELIKDNPNTKIIVLSPPDSAVDLTKLLKMGVAGIVSCDQKEEHLIRAIQQVAEGGVWLNQKLMTKLLNNGSSNGNNGSQKIGLYANDLLTEREIEVVEEITRGISNKEIAESLSISEATVRHHLSSIYGKLELDDRLNLVIYALKENIVSLD